MQRAVKELGRLQVGLRALTDVFPQAYHQILGFFAQRPKKVYYGA
jgi:hypothetical protein